MISVTLNNASDYRTNGLGLGLGWGLRGVYTLQVAKFNFATGWANRLHSVNALLGVRYSPLGR